MAIDLQQIGQGVGAIALGIIAWFGGRATKQAGDSAEIAQSNAQVSIADAESTLYQRLREEIDALRNDVSRLRADLDQERRHSRALELHVWKLERLMRDAGLTPPPFVESTNDAVTSDQSNH